MASGVFDDALIQHLWSTDELRAIFNDHNRVQKWFDFEAALALEQGALGIIPQAAAEDIAANAQISKTDIAAVAAEIRRIKHPLVPAVKAVQQSVPLSSAANVIAGHLTHAAVARALELEHVEPRVAVDPFPFKSVSCGISPVALPLSVAPITAQRREFLPQNPLFFPPKESRS